MLMLNSNTINRIINVLAAKAVKYVIYGLAITSVLAFITVLQDDNITRNNQTATPADIESFVSRLHPDSFYAPDSVLSEAPRATQYTGKLTKYLKPITFTISATDFDGDQLVYSASNLPDGASFDPETRTFTWTPRYDQAGVYSVHFEVSDGQYTDSQDVTITVLQMYEDWDVNGDEATNILDMVLVGQHWGEAGLTGWIPEDTNEDGTISVLDIIIIGQHWTG